MKILCTLVAVFFYLVCADAACETEEASLTTCLTSNSCDTDLDLAFSCLNCLTEAVSYNFCTFQNQIGDLTLPPALGDITLPPAIGDITLPPAIGDITLPPFGDITFPPVDIAFPECLSLIESYGQCWNANAATCYIELDVSCLAQGLPGSCQELSDEAAKCSCSACSSQLQDLLNCFCDSNSSSPAYSLMNAAVVMVAVSAAILL